MRSSSLLLRLLTLGKLVFAMAFFSEVGVLLDARVGVTPYFIRTAEPAPIIND